MDEKFKRIKQLITKLIFKKLRIAIVIIAIAITIIITSIICSVFVVTKNDGSYKNGDNKNVPYVVDQHLSNVSISEDGKISTTKTTRQLWDQMIENGSRVNEYLDNPEELQKLMTAQMVTRYLDTRENPAAPIDWNSFNKNVDSTETQGIVKLKRAFTNGSKELLTYIDPETFQSYIDEYNKTGSEEIKQKAMRYFTIEKGYKASTYGTGELIKEGTTIEVPAGLGSVHTYMGWQMITATTSMQYKLREQAGMNFDEEGFGRINGRYVIACTTTFGKVGDYVDFYQEDGLVIQGIIGDIKNQNDPGCTMWGHNNGQTIVEFVVNKDTWYPSHVNPGTQSCHPEWKKNIVKAVNGGSYFDNPTFGGAASGGTTTIPGGNTLATNVTGSETVSNTTGGQNGSSTASGPKEKLMKWPTDGTDIISWFAESQSKKENKKGNENHHAIDIKVAKNTKVYAAEAGTVTTASKMGTAGKLVVIDHGNGYITKYAHNNQIGVKVGDKVRKGQVIARSGNSEKTGTCLHFEVLYNGERVDPLSFKYDNNMGNGSSGIESNLNMISTNDIIYAKVVTWTETTNKVETNAPDATPMNETTYNMQATKIDYRQYMNGYDMTFDYLWALLVISQSKEFVFDLAELVYNSTIEITVHDNLTKNTNISTNRYTKVEKANSTAIANVKNISTNAITTTNESKQGEVARNTYTTTRTTITKTNTLDIQLTRADVWALDYTAEFEYKAPETEKSNSNINIGDEEYSNTPTRTDSSDPLNILQDVKNAHSSEEVNVWLSNQKTDYYEKKINQSQNIDNTTITQKYVSTPGKTVEKTDKQPTSGENFVSLLIKYPQAKNNIKGAAQWLFDILEKSENTKDMVDLTKYLLYKATNHDYGETKFDEEWFISMNVVEPKKGTAGQEFTRYWENEDVIKYLNNETEYNNKVAKFITKDKKKYKSYSKDKNGQDRNFSYGILFRDPEGKTVNEDKFAELGITNLSQYMTIGSEIDVKVVDQLFDKLYDECKKEVIEKTSEYELNTYQIECLTDMRYQGCIIWEKCINALKTGKNSPIMRRYILYAGNEINDRNRARYELYSNGIYKKRDGTTIMEKAFEGNALGPGGGTENLINGASQSVGAGGYIRGTFTSAITGKTFTIFDQSTGGANNPLHELCGRAAALCIISGYSNKSTAELIDYAGWNRQNNTTLSSIERDFNFTRTARGFVPAGELQTILRNQLTKGGYAVVRVNKNNRTREGKTRSSKSDRNPLDNGRPALYGNNRI